MKKADINICGDIATLEGDGGTFLMDTDDLPLLSGYHLEDRNGYIRLSKRAEGGQRVRTSYHRFIINAPDDMEVDHINRNSYDNRKANLRLCTRSQNARNRKGRKNTSSRFKGVVFDKGHKGSKPWRAYTTIDGRRIWLGYHPTQEAAAKVYDEYAKKQFGQFACLNNV